MNNERGRAISERPLHRDMYLDRAGIKSVGWRSMPEAAAREVANLAIQDASAHPEDIQWVRIAASAAKMSARRIQELQGKRDTSPYAENPSWKEVVGWPAKIAVIHVKRSHGYRPIFRGPSQKYW